MFPPGQYPTSEPPLDLLSNQEGLEDPSLQGQPPPPTPVEEASTPKEPVNPDLPISEELQGSLKDILRYCEVEDQGAYWALVQKWTRLEYYFNNLIAIFWDPNLGAGAGGWRIPNWDDLEDENIVPPRIIAIYRAHAEAVIAALSVNTPSIVFFPDNAEDALDIEAANSASDVAALIQKHIKSPLLFMRILTIMFNQGTVFAYNYYKEDPRYGVKRKPKYETISVPEFQNICPNCENPYGNTEQPIIESLICPVCMTEAPPISIPAQAEMTIQTGWDSSPKGRVLIDIFDPRSVKVSLYATEQAHIGYLLLTFNQSVSMLRSEFKDIGITNQYSQDSLDWARNSVAYMGTAPENVASVKCLWLRPWQFWCMGAKEESINELLALYPQGCYAIFVNDVIKYVTAENLDEHWTITKSPLSGFIHGEPLGTNLATVQDITAEVDELELQIMEHGIPETFVKPETLDLNLYNQQMARPGMITPVKGGDPGEALGSSFFETRPATMSSEIERFGASLHQKAQFTTGSFASIYGGALEGGGGTAYEYKKSNANALQRLGITWKVVAEFWCELIFKATKEFVDTMEDSERFVDRQGGNFVNVEISKASFQGNINRAEPEYSDQLPVTWEQINQVVTNLMGMASPEINAVLFNPNNAEMMKKAIGLQNLYIPGEEERTKQYAEFIQLANSQPMPMIPPELAAQIPPGTDLQAMGVPMQPSVMPEIIDDHLVHMQVLGRILNSARGQRLKAENPGGYQNCMLHYEQHQMMMPPPVEPGEEGEGKEKEKVKGNNPNG